MKRSSSLDCSSIGQSLKRVKISTSPGELRLDRDIESLISGTRWTSAAQSQSPESNDGWPSRGGSSWDRRGSRIHGEIFCHNARLVRDPVDPLRLRLTYLYHPTSPINASPLPPERWMFLIQMPRMYPHVPPVIARVTRDFVPNNENMAHLGNTNLNCYNSSASAAIVASSVMQSRAEPPVPEQALIHNLPPHPNAPVDGGNSPSKLLDIDLATSVFSTWSPVSSLQDLLDFLMGIPARRREWWSVENNRRHHQQQRGILRSHGAIGSPVGQPTIAPASFGHQNFQPVHHPKQQQQHFSSHCDSMEDDGGMNMVETTMEDGRHEFSGTISAERRVNPLAENRFDVGYERGNMIRQWGVL